MSGRSEAMFVVSPSGIACPIGSGAGFQTFAPKPNA